MEALFAQELFENGANDIFGPLYCLPTLHRTAEQMPAPMSTAFSPAEMRQNDLQNERTTPDSSALTAPEKRKALYNFAKYAGSELQLPLYKSRGIYEDDRDRWQDLDLLTRSPRTISCDNAIAKKIMSLVDEPETQWNTIDPSLLRTDALEMDERVEDVRDPLISLRYEEEVTYPNSEDIRIRAPSAEAWVSHTTPLLDEYASRQIHPPFGERINVTLNEPSQFDLGMLQMLSSRDEGGEKENLDPSRRLPEQLLNGFTDIHKWAHEYLRTRFGQIDVGEHVPTLGASLNSFPPFLSDCRLQLLTIMVDNFYEVHMRLIDSIGARALNNMKAREASHLEVQDFAFGFDLQMSQEIPFFVEANHRVRNTLENHRSNLATRLEPLQAVTTRSGWQSKLTEPAQANAHEKYEKALGQRKKKRPPPALSNSTRARMSASASRGGGACRGHQVSIQASADRQDSVSSFSAGAPATEAAVDFVDLPPKLRPTDSRSRVIKNIPKKIISGPPSPTENLDLVTKVGDGLSGAIADAGKANAKKLMRRATVPQLSAEVLKDYRLPDTMNLELVTGKEPSHNSNLSQHQHVGNPNDDSSMLAKAMSTPSIEYPSHSITHKVPLAENVAELRSSGLASSRLIDQNISLPNDNQKSQRKKRKVQECAD